jgi:V-type H+-transporting ATPase subunit e
MGFLVTSGIFLLAGIIGCLFSLLCCNRGPSTNLYVLSPLPP